MEYQVGEKIDNQYVIVEKHHGGMSTVYVARDEFSNKRFAVKTVRENLAADAQAVQRLQTGLFGLAVIMLIVGLADIINERARKVDAASDDDQCLAERNDAGVAEDDVERHGEEREDRDDSDGEGRNRKRRRRRRGGRNRGRDGERGGEGEGASGDDAEGNADDEDGDQDDGDEREASDADGETPRKRRRRGRVIRLEMMAGMPDALDELIRVGIGGADALVLETPGFLGIADLGQLVEELGVHVVADAEDEEASLGGVGGGGITVSALPAR